MDFYYRFIPFLVFLIPFVLSIKQKNNLAFTITGLYFFSTVCSIFMNDDIIPEHDFENESLVSFLLYSLLLVPFLFLSLKLRPIENFESLPSGKLYNIMLMVFCLASWFSIFYLTPYAISSMTVSALEIRRAGEHTLPPTFLTTLATGFPTFYFLYSFLFFISVIQKRHFIVIFSLLLGLVSFIIGTFSVASRDGVLFAILALIIGYFLFKPLLTNKQISRFKTSLIIIGSIGLLLVLKITIDRFSATEEFGMIAFQRGILSYFGQQPFYFADYLEYNDVFFYGKKNFNLFLPLFGIDNNYVPDNLGFFANNFGTFLADFYLFSGYISLILITGFFYMLFRYFLDKIYQYYILSLLFFLGLFFNFMVSGIFYFKLGNEGGNLFILISLTATFVFRRKIIF